MKYLNLTILALLLSFASFAQISAITGILNVCPGGTTALSDATPGGSWSSANPAIVTIGSITGIATAVSAGVATITYTVGPGYVTTTVTVNALTVYTVSGGGSACAGGGTGFHIFLSGSDVGTNYQLFISGAPAGLTMPGSGHLLDFGVQTAAGTYSVVATNTLGCFGMMSGTAVIAINPLPVAFAVVGGGGYCVGGVGTNVGLSGSNTGTTYQLMHAGVPMGAPLAGTGSALDFGMQTVTGTYTVAGTDAATGCMSNMTGSAVVTTGPMPATYNLSGGGVYCTGSPGAHIYLSGSQTSATYQLFNGSMAIGLPVTGTGGVLDLGAYTAGGSYAAVASIGGCMTNMNGTVVISSAPGSPCTGTPYAGVAAVSSSGMCAGTTITLSLTGALACGTTFSWQYSTDFITWHYITGATSLWYTYVPTQSRYYRCVVTCTASGLSAYSTAVYSRVSHGINTHNIVASPDTSCRPATFYLNTCTADPAYYVVTQFGDGSTSTTHLTVAGGISEGYIYHVYTQPGTYTVRQILYNTAGPVDTATFSYTHYHCSLFPLNFYFDANSNCVYDGGDYPLTQPVLIAVDSAGITIDTANVTSGLYYKARGPVGTVYRFNVVTPGGLHAVCPGGSILYDTVQALVNDYTPKSVGFICSSSPAFDLTESIHTIAGRHGFYGDIYVSNSSCTPKNATMTMHFSPKYNTVYATPWPTTISGNTATWNLSGISSSASQHISFSVERSGPWLIPAVDTVNSAFIISGASGESDTLNNTWTKNDTVTASYDPNEMQVSPMGYILPCTPLQYTIEFENTGNDTAQNISVLDTLSDNVDPQTLRIVFASAQMNIAMLNDGSGHNVVKFDFPNIKLLDSTHHGLCQGTIIYTIKARTGLADGTCIFNHAGIFFDDNPAVITNTVQNVTGIGPVNGLTGVCVGAHDTLSNTTAGGVWSSSNANATVAAGIVMGVTGGADTISYTVSNVCASKTATKVITINPLPLAGSITGARSVCNGSSVTLADTVHGGVWSSSNPTVATVSSGGVVSGVSASTATINYTTSNSCGNTVATATITVNPLPAPYTVSGGGGYCTGGTGAHIAIGGSETVVNYQVYLGGSPIGSALAGTGTTLDLGLFTTAGTYTVHATNSATSCTNNMPGSAVITLIPTVTPSVSITPIEGSTLCAGITADFTATATNGGTIPDYVWKVNGIISGTGSTFSYTPSNGDLVTARLTSHALCPLPDTAVASVTMTVVPPAAPSISLSASPGTTIKPAQTDTLVASVTTSCSSPTYQWMINSTPVPGATSSVYICDILYNDDSVSCIVNCGGDCGGAGVSSIYIRVNSVGVHDPGHATETVGIYPNPTKGIFTIKWIIPSASASEDVSVEIIDLLGQVVYTQKTTAHNGNINEQVQPGQALARGIYLLYLKSENGNEVFRLVVE